MCVSLGFQEIPGDIQFVSGNKTYVSLEFSEIYGDIRLSLDLNLTWSLSVSAISRNIHLYPAISTGISRYRQISLELAGTANFIWIPEISLVSPDISFVSRPPDISRDSQRHHFS